MFRFFSRIFAKILGKAVNIPSEAASTAIGFAVSSAVTAPIKPLQKELNKKFPYEQLAIGELQELLLREKISKEEFSEELAKKGFNSEKIEQLIELAGYVPTVPDWIRFAVRDIFDEEVVDKYKLNQEYPDVLNKYVKLAGLSPEYAKYYWQAHWTLPSLTQAFDMYHRDIITLEDINLLLKTADVLPHWRDKLIKLAERPFTRVDLGRMYKVDVLNFEELVRGYRDIGYSVEKATKMAEFITSEGMGASKELSKTEVLATYYENLISKEQAEEALRNMGYSEEEIGLLISSYENRKVRSYTNKYINAIKREYTSYRLTSNQVRDLLEGLNLATECIAIMLDTWELEILPRYRKPSKSDLLKWFKAGKITEVEAREGLINLGYATKWIDLYVGVD